MPHARIPRKELIRWSAGPGTRRRFIPLRVGRHLPVSGGASPRAEPFGARSPRTGGDREVEPAYGAGTVRCHRTHGSKYQSDLPRAFQAIPGLRRTLVYQRLERMDRELNGHQFVAGDRFTIADITALVAIDIGGRLADIKIAPELASL